MWRKETFPGAWRRVVSAKISASFKVMSLLYCSSPKQFHCDANESRCSPTFSFDWLQTNEVKGVKGWSRPATYLWLLPVRCQSHRLPWLLSHSTVKDNHESTCCTYYWKTSFGAISCGLNFSIQEVKIWLMILAYISGSKVWSSHRMTRKTTHTGVLPSHILGESPRGILCIKDDPKNFDVTPIMLNSIWVQPNAICKRVQAELHTVLNSTGPSHGSTPPTRRATWFCEFEVH